MSRLQPMSLQTSIKGALESVVLGSTGILTQTCFTLQNCHAH